MSWTQSILAFIAVNLIAVGLMVLPYYLAINGSVVTASEQLVPTQARVYNNDRRSLPPTPGRALISQFNTG